MCISMWYTSVHLACSCMRWFPSVSISFLCGCYKHQTGRTRNIYIYFWLCAESVSLIGSKSIPGIHQLQWNDVTCNVIVVACGDVHVYILIVYYIIKPIVGTVVWLCWGWKKNYNTEFFPVKKEAPKRMLVKWQATSHCTRWCLTS